MRPPPAKPAFGDMSDPDVRRAWNAFGGKSIEAAFQVFLSNPFGHVHNFLYVGPEAFAFYFPAVARYVTSDDSKGDSDTISSLAGVLESQLKHHTTALIPVLVDIAEVCRHVVGHYQEFDLDFDIYGDVRSRYEQIGQKVELGGELGGPTPRPQ